MLDIIILIASLSCSFSDRVPHVFPHATGKYLGPLREALGLSSKCTLIAVIANFANSFIRYKDISGSQASMYVALR